MAKRNAEETEVKEPKKKPVMSSDRDELAKIIADSLNKLNKEEQIAYFLDGKEETPTDINDFISTGATMLDIAVSNRPHGGIAVGRITEITGLEGSGKSLVGATLVANTIKRGGVGVFIDTENAVNEDFFQAVGVNMGNMVYVHIQSLEEIFEAITNIIEKVRNGSEKDRDKIVTIVVDSVAGASTKKELEADFSKDGYATDKAIIISKALRKITGMIGRQKVALVFTNQLRQKMNAMPFSDPWTTSGGKAIAFHASTRVRLSLTGKISLNDVVVGVKVKANVVKSRLGPPLRVAEFNIYFDRGIDDYASWLDVLKDQKIVKSAGAWNSYVDESGQEHKFQAKDFPAFLDADPARKEALYMQICNALIMKYQTEYDTAEVDFTSAVEEE
jgi:recombination protein RecA